MLQHLNNQLGKGVAALAVMLIAMLVVQASVAMVDRALHASGQAHAANAFAGPLAIDVAYQDHDHHHDDAADAADAAVLSVDDDRDHSSQAPHHHHDGPSLLSVTATMALTSPWAAAKPAWPCRDSSLVSAEPSTQKRPPKASLEHVA